ncbi:MAG: hypothetical protein AB1Z55_02520 [Acidimicrobiia bacterium]
MVATARRRFEPRPGASTLSLTRRSPHWRVFATGATLLLLGIMGLRALH